MLFSFAFPLPFLCYPLEQRITYLNGREKSRKVLSMEIASEEGEGAKRLIKIENYHHHHEEIKGKSREKD